MALFITDSNNVLGKYVEEAGQYNVKVANSSTTKNSNSGKPMLVLDYEVVDGPYKGGLIRYDNMVWDDSDQSHEDMSIRRFNTFTSAMGVPDGVKVESLQQLLSAAIGHELSVVVDWQQAQNGKWYLTVQRQAKVLDGGSKPNGKKRPEEGTANNNNGFGGNNFANQQQPDNNQGAQDLNDVPF